MEQNTKILLFLPDLKNFFLLTFYFYFVRVRCFLFEPVFDARLGLL